MGGFDSKRHVFMGLLFAIVIIKVCHGQTNYSEDPPYDGWFNNLVHPDWGAADTQLLRISPPAYSDGVYTLARHKGPNALNISTDLHSGPQGLTSTRNRTAFMVFFGQQIVEEIVDSQRQSCPPEHFGIEVPRNHSYRRSKGNDVEDLELPMRRARFDQSTGYSPNVPRQQLNEITPFLDGNLMYGPLKAWTDAIREHKDGLLKARDEDKGKPISETFPSINKIRLPFANPPEPRSNAHRPVSRFGTIGNPRGNENPFLLGLGILWFRWHNYVAGEIKKEGIENDERIFNEARKRVVAHYQKIVFKDWLPDWLGVKRRNSSDKYDGYKPNVHPGISQEFQTAAMRYGHTLIPTSVYRRYGNCTRFESTNRTHNLNATALRLCNIFWNSDEAVEENLDALFLGMASTLAEKEDHIVTDDVRLNVFGPREFTRRDLVALNIMRGRDHGVADYNTVREAYGLARKKNFSDAFTDPILADKAEEIYVNLSNVDLFTGGLLETDEDGPGELFRDIMYEQFVRIRDGDRFWYENYKMNGLFTEEQFLKIEKITLKEILLAVTNIKSDEIQDNPFIKSGDPCDGFDDIPTKYLDECGPLKRFDYFKNSEVSFALTFLAIFFFILGMIALLLLLVRRRKRQDRTARNKRVKSEKEVSGQYRAMEWLGPKTGERKVIVTFDTNRFKIMVRSGSDIVRMLDLRNLKEHLMTRCSSDGDKDLIIICVPKESDLVLRFVGYEKRETFSNDLTDFLTNINCRLQKNMNTARVLLTTAHSKESRDEVINNVMKVVCLQAFGANRDRKVSQERFDEVINIQMTKSEFAEILSLQPNSMFVRNMFTLVDKDRNGYLTFREFLDMFVVFASDSLDDHDIRSEKIDGAFKCHLKDLFLIAAEYNTYWSYPSEWAPMNNVDMFGKAEQKTKLMFDMYDVRRQGYLRVKDFKDMIRSMLELGNASLDSDQIDKLSESMLRGAGLAGNTEIVFEDFKKIFNEHSDTIGMATINLQGIASDSMPQEGRGGNNDLKKRLRKTIIKYGSGQKKGGDNAITRNRETTIRLETVQHVETEETRFTPLIRFLENYRLQIFWMTLYTLTTIGIFIERSVYYSIEREHGGLRQIAGYGVTVTRGAASGMMFTYATLLVTMSRNVITSLRETIVNRIFPLDSYISFHKYVALLALIFTIVHLIGHAFNLYHICTQNAIDANCLFREYFRASHEIASFHYWAFGTITGICGVIATVIVIIIFVFAVQYSRRHLFKIFWFTHSLYPLLFVFMVLHGLGRLVQSPLTHYYILGPVILFIFDRFMMFGRRSIEISVFNAHILPSDVTSLVFKKPRNFDYRSGQWVRIACLELSKNEFHPFTLSSAPHEDTLSLHIRAVGPWTKNVRRIYDSINRDGRPFPRLYLDGPYGEGHQDWYQYDVSVLVGGGIGVTPFASILKDIVYRSKVGAAIQCQKVYFLWVTRTQKQFEWMTDIIRHVEESDGRDIVSVHIFITQFFHKFDLRTTMLYICERNFQKIAQKSLFTGLRSVTHFGRPDFYDFLLSLHEEHSKVTQFGVFSCGPPPMTRNVEVACSKLNRYNGPSYIHHYENF